MLSISMKSVERLIVLLLLCCLAVFIEAEHEQHSLHPVASPPIIRRQVAPHAFEQGEYIGTVPLTWFEQYLNSKPHPASAAIGAVGGQPVFLPQTEATVADHAGFYYPEETHFYDPSVDPSVAFEVDHDYYYPDFYYPVAERSVPVNPLFASVAPQSFVLPNINFLREVAPLPARSLVPFGPLPAPAVVEVPPLPAVAPPILLAPQSPLPPLPTLPQPALAIAPGIPILPAPGILTPTLPVAHPTREHFGRLPPPTGPVTGFVAQPVPPVPPLVVSPPRVLIQPAVAPLPVPIAPVPLSAPLPILPAIPRPLTFPPQIPLGPSVIPPPILPTFDPLPITSPVPIRVPQPVQPALLPPAIVAAFPQPSVVPAFPQPEFVPQPVLPQAPLTIQPHFLTPEFIPQPAEPFLPQPQFFHPQPLPVPVPQPQPIPVPIPQPQPFPVPVPIPVPVAIPPIPPLPSPQPLLPPIIDPVPLPPPQPVLPPVLPALPAPLKVLPVVPPIPPPVIVPVPAPAPDPYYPPPKRSNYAPAAAPAIVPHQVPGIDPYARVPSEPTYPAPPSSPSYVHPGSPSIQAVPPPNPHGPISGPYGVPAPVVLPPIGENLSPDTPHVVVAHFNARLNPELHQQIQHIAPLDPSPGIGRLPPVPHIPLPGFDVNTEGIPVITPPQFRPQPVPLVPLTKRERNTAFELSDIPAGPHNAALPLVRPIPGPVPRIPPLLENSGRLRPSQNLPVQRQTENRRQPPIRRPPGPPIDRQFERRATVVDEPTERSVPQPPAPPEQTPTTRRPPATPPAPPPAIQQRTSTSSPSTSRRPAASPPAPPPQRRRTERLIPGITDVTIRLLPDPPRHPPIARQAGPVPPRSNTMPPSSIPPGATTTRRPPPEREPRRQRQLGVLPPQSFPPSSFPPTVGGILPQVAVPPSHITDVLGPQPPAPPLQPAVVNIDPPPPLVPALSVSLPEAGRRPRPPPSQPPTEPRTFRFPVPAQPPLPPPEQPRILPPRHLGRPRAFLARKGDVLRFFAALAPKPVRTDFPTPTVPPLPPPGPPITVPPPVFPPQIVPQAIVAAQPPAPPPLPPPTTTPVYVPPSTTTEPIIEHLFNTPEPRRARVLSVRRPKPYVEPPGAREPIGILGRKDDIYRYLGRIAPKPSVIDGIPRNHFNTYTAHGYSERAEGQWRTTYIDHHSDNTARTSYGRHPPARQSGGYNLDPPPPWPPAFRPYGKQRDVPDATDPAAGQEPFKVPTNHSTSLDQLPQPPTSPPDVFKQLQIQIKRRIANQTANQLFDCDPRAQPLGPCGDGENVLWARRSQCAIRSRHSRQLVPPMYSRNDLSCTECLKLCAKMQDNDQDWQCRSVSYDHRSRVCDMMALKGAEAGRAYKMAAYQSRDYFELKFSAITRNIFIVFVTAAQRLQSEF